jgi:septum site-determining protein MinD
LGKLFAVVSGKGGTGKSTVAAGVGAALARRGRRVLLVDADEGLRCLDLILGVADKTVFDAGDLIAGHCAASDAVYPVPDCEGLFLMAAPAVPGQLRDAALLRDVCVKLAMLFDDVLLDCPAGIGGGFRTVVSCTSNALVVVNTDPPSLRAAALVNALLEQYGVAHRRLIINKFAALSVESGRSPNIDGIIDQTGIRLLGLVPYDNQIAEAAARAKPLVFGAAAAAFDRIASRLLGEAVPLRVGGGLFV